MKNILSTDEQLFWLGEYWDDHAERPEALELYNENHLGMALAWACYCGVATPTDNAKRVIHRTFSALLAKYEVPADDEIESVNEIVNYKY